MGEDLQAFLRGRRVFSRRPFIYGGSAPGARREELSDVAISFTEYKGTKETSRA